MHEHDLDLIMALAEGSLGDSDAAAAERDIASCETCAADLALQRSALELLSEAPRVYMTATESARLREGIRSELGLAPSAPVTPQRRPRRFAFGALAGAAAVLLAVVVAGPALDILGSDDDSATADVALSAPTAEIAEASADTMTEEMAPAPAAAEATDPASGGTAEIAAAPQMPILQLESEADLAALKSTVLTRAQDSSREFDGSDLFPAGEPDLAPAGDAPVEDLPAPPPEPMPAPAPPMDASQDAQCEPDELSDPNQKIQMTVVQPVIYQGIDALLFAYITDPIENSSLIVVDAVTCEVLARA